MAFTIAILGRPNVGKSTLFNRLVGRPLAIVDDEAGVTRDLRYGEARLGDISFTLIDTAGLEEAPKVSLAGRMTRQSEKAAAAADLAFLVIDARVGLTEVDRHFARHLRKLGIRALLLANKSEGHKGAIGALEGFDLGLGAPIPISAAHGEGLDLLYDALRERIPREDAGAPSHPPAADRDRRQAPPLADVAIEEIAPDNETETPHAIQIAIVGRPNVGKSTLVNGLIGADRQLTGPEAGITRDAIAIDWRWRDQDLRLIDTAGLRRRARVTEKLERLAGFDSLRAIRFAQIVILVLDSHDMLEAQDLAIARHVIEEGRALVIAANKWDAIENRQAALDRLKDRLARSLPQIKDVPIVTISAETGRNLDRLMETTIATYRAWNRRIPTHALNRWLMAVTGRHPPPLIDGRRIRLKYMTQIKTRPPSFALFATKAASLPDSYARYLANELGSAFDLAGVPLRLEIRANRNPFAKGKEG